MRYIRTKDNEIYETTEYYMMPLGYPEYRVKGSTKSFSEYIDVVKQANTIEELCDEFVIIFPDETWETYKLFCVLEDCLKMDYYKGCKYYGAIWTDKGIVYVAKMNEEGELELL